MAMPGIRVSGKARAWEVEIGSVLPLSDGLLVDEHPKMPPTRMHPNTGH